MNPGYADDASWLDSRGFRWLLLASALAHLGLGCLLALERARAPELEEPVYVAVLTSLPLRPAPPPEPEPPAAAPLPEPEPVELPPEPAPKPPPPAARPAPTPPPPLREPPIAKPALPPPPAPEPVRTAPPPSSPRPAPAPAPPPDVRPLFPSSPAPKGPSAPADTAPRIERPIQAQRRPPSAAPLPSLVAQAPPAAVVESASGPLRVERTRASSPAAARAPMPMPAAAAPLGTPDEPRELPAAIRAGPARVQGPSSARRPPPQAAPPPPPSPASARPTAPPVVQRTGAARPAASASRSRADHGIRGVPLASLAACVSDADEERWKRKVLAAVGSREACTSAAGHYRFVETKNLNAFLMWIEVASHRRQGDRCDELSLALACLQGGAGQGRESR